ncbi:peptide chain release factor N(5)-glutamine methyltransferase [Acinetobacter sp. c1-l78]|uniref:peptide chain release factor N(5)-glutamine methyltransferase n=1 Tax=Acinetobacter sp. c1-l78 TaxID=3342803 RepID=UPI0035B96E44
MLISQALNLYGEPDSYERQENTWLLAEIVGCSALELKLLGEKVLTDTQQQQYLQGLARLKQGEPLAYILGSQPFWTLDLTVNQHTLIPRPDSEIVVESILSLPVAMDAQILDMGTGTGAIGLALASERPTWQVTLTDIHLETIKTAEYNAKKHDLNNVRFALGVWYQALQNTDFKDKFDVIVSNPPYLADDDSHLDTLLKYEPKRALVADKQGLSDIEIIVSDAKNHLKVNGFLLIEHGYQQAESVQAIFKQHGLQAVKTIKDYGDNDRVTIGRFL